MYNIPVFNSEPFQHLTERTNLITEPNPKTAELVLLGLAHKPSKSSTRWHLGDPIEVSILSRCFQASQPSATPNPSGGWKNKDIHKTSSIRSRFIRKTQVNIKTHV